MRRKEKEITDRAEIESVISRSTVCYLSMCDGDRPYTVPLCFGYDKGVLYFHSALSGRKIDVLKQNDRVCFVFVIDPELVRKGEDGCDWGIRYQSVIGSGRAVFVQEGDSKRKALDVILSQYADGRFQYVESKLKNTLVIRIDIEEMTGKRSG
jgi:nitroimidazol reductase NimA-like FMN-containing flavoprotein (pyridoxamine 5'-phosphate oxidase superfamily)